MERNWSSDCQNIVEHSTKNHRFLTIGDSTAEAVVLTNTKEETAETRQIAMSVGKFNLPSGFEALRTKDNLMYEN